MGHSKVETRWCITGEVWVDAGGGVEVLGGRGAVGSLLPSPLKALSFLGTLWWFQNKILLP